jgi:hypothetical protein
MTAPRGGDTVAQLKADIDAGRTGDKVAAGDPGLSPLGTDDEAAGRPASPAIVRAARSEEARIGDLARAEPAKPERAVVVPALLAALVLVIAVAVVYGLWRSLAP